MYTTEINANGVVMLSDSQLDFVAGGWSAMGMLGSAVAGALVGGATGALAGGVGAAPGAVLGAAAGAVSYNIQHMFED